MAARVKQRKRTAGRLGREQAFIGHLLQISKGANKIPIELYARYGVKRGLRNEDGTGVLVGLTEIGNVRGYVVVDNVKRPCEGVLQYRGIDMRAIIDGYAKEKRHGFEETCFLLLFGKLPAKAVELAKEAGRQDEFGFYELVERLAPTIVNEHKKSDKPICANVDFYSGLVYRMLGIPEDLFTPLFAIARIAGWCAHVIEEYVSGGRIMRPAYLNVTAEQPYVAIKERT